MAKYQTNFELGLTDVSMIEESLTERASELARTILEKTGNGHCHHDEAVASLRDDLASVRETLGRLHNQKIWYQPEDYVPQG